MRILFILALVIVVVKILPSSDSSADKPIAKAAHIQGDKAGAVAHFKSDAEPRVLHAKWVSSSSLVLGMFDDGTNRDGFADYACQVLISDFGFRGQSVSIFIKNAKLKRLGESFCN